MNYLEEYIERLEEISARYGVSLIFLFGSRNDTGIAYLEGKAIEEQDPMADLDIGVVFQRGKFPAKPYKVYAQLYADLSVLFDPFKLDLVFLQETHSLIQFEAIKGNCIFATTAQAKIDYIEDVLRRGADWKPVMDKFYQELAEITGVG